MLTNKQAFTLIELLVVVLIIGILAAVAVPQYKVAVGKTRFSEMLLVVQAIKNAQEIYYLAHGVYAKKIEELDVQWPAGATISTNDEGHEVATYPNGNFFRVYVYGQIIGTNENNQLIVVVDRSDPNLQGYRKACYARTNLGQKICKALGGNQLTTPNSKYFGLL